MDPLRDIATGTSRYQLVVRPGERIADGSSVVINEGHEPVELISAEPVFQDAPQADVILGVHVIRYDKDEDSFGIARSYPPPGATLQDVAGLVLEPAEHGGTRYQFMLGIRVGTKDIALTELRVVYRTAGETYALTLRHFVDMCVGRPAGATSC